MLSLLVAFYRGPSHRSHGKVLLVFEDHGSSKVGVRFDKSIPYGNDLGNHSEYDHGNFFYGESIYSFVLAFYVLKIV